MIERKVRRFMPGESLNTVFSARTFGLCLAVDIIEALKEIPDIENRQGAWLNRDLKRWVEKWFSDFMEKGGKNG